MTPEQRIVELEIRLAHLEHALQDVSDAVVRQQQEIAQLGERSQRLQERVTALQSDVPGDVATREEIPPHY